LKDKAFSTFLGQNAPLELQPKNRISSDEHAPSAAKKPRFSTPLACQYFDLRFQADRSSSKFWTSFNFRRHGIIHRAVSQRDLAVSGAELSPARFKDFRGTETRKV
jgi:hypothetical protein